MGFLWDFNRISMGFYEISYGSSMKGISLGFLLDFN